MNESSAAKWFYHTRAGEPIGPVSLDEIVARASDANMIPPLKMVWTDGMASWQAAQDVPELAQRLASRESGAAHSQIGPQATDSVSPASMTRSDDKPKVAQVEKGVSANVNPRGEEMIKARAAAKQAAADEVAKAEESNRLREQTKIAAMQAAAEAKVKEDERIANSGKDEWFYLVNGEHTGPVTLAVLRSKLDDSTLNPPLKMVWTEGMDQWRPVYEVSKLCETLPEKPQENALKSSHEERSEKDIHSEEARAMADEVERQGKMAEARVEEEARVAALAKAKAQDDERLRLAEAARVQAEAQAKAEEEARVAAALAKARAEQEARAQAVEEARLKNIAEVKAAEEARAVAFAAAEAEQSRLRAENEARIAREDAKLKAAEEVRLKSIAEAKAAEDARAAAFAQAKEDVRLRAENEARIASEKAEAKAAEEVRLKAIAEAKAAEEARAAAFAQAKEGARLRAENEARVAREESEAKVAAEQARLAAIEKSRADQEAAAQAIEALRIAEAVKEDEAAKLAAREETLKTETKAAAVRSLATTVVEDPHQKTAVVSPTPRSSSEAVWFYTREGDRIGPVEFTDLRVLADAQTLNPRMDLVWKQGMDEWKPAGLIEGLFDRRCGPSELVENLAPSAVITSPSASEDVREKMASSGAWPGARRRSFIVAILIFPTLWAIFLTFITPLFTKEFGLEITTTLIPIASFVPLIVTVYFVFKRLSNLGMSRWWFFGFLVPLLNFWVSYRCFVCPAGYAFYKKLDAVGIVLAVIFWLIFVCFIVAGVIVVAVMLGGLGNPEIQEKLRSMIDLLPAADKP